MAKLNNNQTPFSVNELNKIENNIKRYNKYTDGINDKLVKEVNRYQRRYVELLREAKFNSITDIGRLSPMEQLGFQNMAVEYMQEYPSNAERELKNLQSLGLGTSLSRIDFNTTIRAIQRADFNVFRAEAESLDAMIKSRLVNSYVLGEDFQKSVSILANDMLGADEKLGSLARFSSTYMNTAFTALGRTVDQEVYAREGGLEDDAEYIYAGPVDNKTSDICLQYVGQVLRRSEWLEIGDGEGVDIFTIGLHFNCRHKLLLVRS